MGYFLFIGDFCLIFSEIADPIIQLTRKYAKFHWTPECEKAFVYIKDKLSTIPLLAYPDKHKHFYLYTDASDKSICACLTKIDEETKAEKPIYFLSHKLSDTQSRWSTIEKEAYAIHYALQKLDHYLHGAKFTIRTDHKPLKYLLESPMQNKKIQLWSLTIMSYDCTIEYISGDTNCADILSRPHLDQDFEIDNGNNEPVDVSDKTYAVNTINSNRFDLTEFARCQVNENDPPEKNRS